MLATLDLPAEYQPTRRAHMQFLETLLRRSLSYYCLIRYTGRRSGPHPIIGVVLVHPSTGLGLVRWNLARCGEITPRSRHWRQIEEYLRLLQTAFDTGVEPAGRIDLEEEREALDTIWPRWQRLVAFSPVYAGVGYPYTLLERLLETFVVKTPGTRKDGCMSKHEVAEALVTNEACQFVLKFLEQMSAKDVAHAAYILRNETGPDVATVKVKMYEHLFATVLRHVREREPVLAQDAEEALLELSMLNR